MIRILWITNILFPEAVQNFTHTPVISRSGGWMIGAANALLEQGDVELCVATVSNYVNELIRVNGKKWTYYVLPLGRGAFQFNSEYEPYWVRIKNEYKPDVVHIHGTELSHGLAYINACSSDKVVVSIQGLTSVISMYYDYGISRKELLRSITFRDIFRGTILKDKKVYKQRGEYEVDLLRKVKHVIGRTEWDKSHVWAISPSAKYYFCNETLQSAFYEGRWSYENCKPHTIFISQASYPIKGFHQVLKALPLVLKHYPDTKVRVAGSYRQMATLKDRLKMSGYENYLNQLIAALHLENSISWLGPIDVTQMKTEYLTSNVFICPSSIENSPNSLCEAQMLGTPCIASYVGGTKNLVPNEYCGKLYRYEEVEMLAFAICSIFEKSASFDNTIMRNTARGRHDPIANAQSLLRIYNSVLVD